MTNRFLKGIAGCLPNAVAALLLIPSVSPAGIPDVHVLAKAPEANSKPDVFPIDSKPYGKSYSRWSVLWWQWFLPLTHAQFDACAIGNSGPVAFLLAGPATCTGTVHPGTALFFPIANAECSDLEAPPFHGETPAERANCAAFWADAAGALEVRIDGDRVNNPNRYQALSPDFSFTIGPDNVYGMPCSPESSDRRGHHDDQECSGKASGNGFYLMIAPLSPGDHKIHITASGFGIDTKWILKVGH